MVCGDGGDDDGDNDCDGGDGRCECGALLNTYYALLLLLLLPGRQNSGDRHEGKKGWRRHWSEPL